MRENSVFVSYIYRYGRWKIEAREKSGCGEKKSFVMVCFWHVLPFINPSSSSGHEFVLAFHHNRQSMWFCLSFCYKKRFLPFIVFNASTHFALYFISRLHNSFELVVSVVIALDFVCHCWHPRWMLRCNCFIVNTVCLTQVTLLIARQNKHTSPWHLELMLHFAYYSLMASSKWF